MNFEILRIFRDFWQKENREQILSSIFFSIDTFLGKRIFDTVDAPPSNSISGDIYLIGPAPTGRFAAKSDWLAYFYNGSWRLYPPREGFLFYHLTRKLLLLYNGTEWIDYNYSYNTTRPAVGHTNRTDSVMTFTDATRTFNISGTYEIWQQGERQLFTSASNDFVISDVTGLHWVHFNNKVLEEYVNPTFEQFEDLIANKVLTSFVYWNSTDAASHLLADERHGVNIARSTLGWGHFVVQSAHVEGFDLSGITLDTDSDSAISFELTDGIFMDEDLIHKIKNGTPGNYFEQILNGQDAQVRVFYRQTDGAWTSDTASTLPYKTAGSGRLAYNPDNGMGSYSQVELGNQDFMSYTLMCLNSQISPVIMIQGQRFYETSSEAKEDGPSEIINFGDNPSIEYIYLYRFVMQSSNGYSGAKKARIISITDYRKVTFKR